MKICVLDAATLGHDLDLSPLSAVGEVTVYTQTPPELVRERIVGHDVVVINKVKLNAHTLPEGEDAPKLVCICATGYDSIELDVCRERGIGVANVVGYSSESVAQVTVSGNDVAPAAQTEGNGENAVNTALALTVECGEAPLLAPYAPFIQAALDGDSSALRAAAKTLGKMPDALADEINALTADGEIGDIVLEDDGMGGYTVIEDYREQVMELLRL